MDALKTFELESWEAEIPEPIQSQAAAALEIGQVLFFPRLPFVVAAAETHLLSPQLADPKSKNISFDAVAGRLQGAVCGGEDRQRLQAMIARFAGGATALVGRLIPRYKAALQAGRTSFRPVEIKERASSYRKDDTRLHVDAFPSTPVRDKRILRLFSNVNPALQERVWRVGAPFEEAARFFLPQIRSPFPAEGAVLEALKITKSRRTAYDHTMLQLHDRMKADTQYQASVQQTEIRFPAGSTWMVFTDQVSHAAMSGQHTLEQTFYLPVDAMKEPACSPLRVLERLRECPLI